MKAYQDISVTEAWQIIKDQQPLILDCRALKDYRKSHIEAAMHVHEQLRDSLVKRGDKEKPLLIYCYHGHASQHLAEFFCDFGFKNVYSLTGGYAGWSQSTAQNLNLEETL